MPQYTCTQSYSGGDPAPTILSVTTVVIAPNVESGLQAVQGEMNNPKVFVSSTLSLSDLVEGNIPMGVQQVGIAAAGSVAQTLQGAGLYRVRAPNATSISLTLSDVVADGTEALVDILETSVSCTSIQINTVVVAQSSGEFFANSAGITSTLPTATGGYSVPQNYPLRISLEFEGDAGAWAIVGRRFLTQTTDFGASV